MTDMKKTHKLLAATVMLAIGSSWAHNAPAFANVMDDDDGPAITARVRGTFQDATGGGGVLSGDMSIVRFEVRDGKVTAIGEITGAMADSSGNILGQVNQQLALPVLRVGSTCNQLRMELASADAEVLKRQVHFDQEVAGFDSRENGMAPKALDALCDVQALLTKGEPTADALAATLNQLALRVATGQAREYR
jgi:hypothetical protein